MSDKPKCKQGYQAVQFDGQWICVPVNITNRQAFDPTLEDLLRAAGVDERHRLEAKETFEKVDHAQGQYLDVLTSGNALRVQILRHGG